MTTCFNLIIIGDEILHGNRTDKHFAFFKTLLESRGLRLNTVQYLPDEREILVRQLQRSFTDALPTFVTGGIGATPDDHTRQSAAAALGKPLVRHPQAAAYIDTVTLERGQTLDSPEHHQRLRMADFPEGADIIENAYNRIAGFSIRQHYFLPGFPVMASPMAEWVLQRYYAEHFHQRQSDYRATRLFRLSEAQIGPLMEAWEHRFPGIRTYSLPTVRTHNPDGTENPSFIEFGLKAEGTACAQLPEAWQLAVDTFRQMGGECLPLP